MARTNAWSAERNRHEKKSQQTKRNGTIHKNDSRSIWKPKRLRELPSNRPFQLCLIRSGRLPPGNWSVGWGLCRFLFSRSLICFIPRWKHLPRIFQRPGLEPQHPLLIYLSFLLVCLVLGWLLIRHWIGLMLAPLWAWNNIRQLVSRQL